MLYDEREGWGLVASLVESRDWWTIIPVDRDGLSALTALESEFFRGDAAADLVLVVVSNFIHRVQALYFARKTRLPVTDLKRWYGDYVDYPSHEWDEQDIMVWASSAMPVSDRLDVVRSLGKKTGLFDPEAN